MIISTPVFLRFSASVSVRSCSRVGLPSLNRMATLRISSRKAKSILVVRSPSAIFVRPPSYEMFLIAGSRSLMLLYASKAISKFAVVLYLTTPIRTFNCKISNPRIMAPTQPRTSRSQASGPPTNSMLVESSRINAMSMTWFGHAAKKQAQYSIMNIMTNFSFIR